MMRPYQWPAARIDRPLMRRLAQVRDSSTPRTPITELIRRALVEVYGDPAVIRFPSVSVSGEEVEAA